MNHTHTDIITTLEDCTGQHLMSIIPCYDTDCGLALNKVGVVLRTFCCGSAETRTDAPLQNSVETESRRSTCCRHLVRENVFTFFGRVFFAKVFPKTWRRHNKICL